jgi:hypothetical protein
MKIINIQRLVIALSLLATGISPVLIGCASVENSSIVVELPEQRSADFTLGVVVFRSSDLETPDDQSMRFIVDPAGVLRASKGAGSTGLTHPLYTRQLNEDQLDRIWTMVTLLGLEKSNGINAVENDGTIEQVLSPEEYQPEGGNGILVEVRSQRNQGAWQVGIEDKQAGILIDQLKTLAWMKD